MEAITKREFKWSGKVMDDCLIAMILIGVGAFVMGLSVRGGGAQKVRPLPLGHHFDPIHNGADECECGQTKDAHVR